MLPATTSQPCTPLRERVSNSLDSATRWCSTIAAVMLALLFIGGLWCGAFVWWDGSGGAETGAGEIMIRGSEGAYLGTGVSSATSTPSASSFHAGFVSSGGDGALWGELPYSARLMRFRIVPIWGSHPQAGWWFGLPIWIPLAATVALSVYAWRTRARSGTAEHGCKAKQSTTSPRTDGL